MDFAEIGFRVGDCRVDPAQRLIEGPGGVSSVEPKVMAVLLYLVERPQVVVSRTELMDAVWPNAVISDEVLSRAIYRLRQHLGDDGRSPDIILTVPKKGYRLAVAPQFVEPLEITETAPDPRRALHRYSPVALAAAGLIAALAILWWRLPGYDVAGPGTRADDVVTDSRVRSRIAVLPFDDLSDDSSKRYFSDGLTEELMSALSSIERVGVVARTSSYVFRDSVEDATSIGRKLNADHLLQGSINFDGNRYRVVVHLIDTRKNATLWTRTYDGVLADVFADYDEITASIAESLQLQLTADRRNLTGRRPKDVGAAYRLYLEGRYYFHQRNPGALQQSVAFFRQALDADPDYALAWVGLADAHMLSSLYGDRVLDDALSDAYAAAVRALEINDELAEAHASLGLIQLHTGKSDEAVRELRLAASLNPNYVMAHNWLGQVLRAQGQFRQELAAYQRALDLDPLSPIVNMNVGMVLTLAGRYTDAQQKLRRAIELDPDFANAHWALAYSLWSSGRLAAAIDAFGDAMSLGLVNDALLGQLALVYLDLGDIDNVRNTLGGVSEFPTTNISSHWAFAARLGLMTVESDSGGDLALLSGLLAQHPEDASLRLEYMLAAIRNNELTSAIDALADLDPGNPATRAVLFDQWDVEAGYLHAVTLANLYQQVNMPGEAEEMIAQSVDYLADARRRGINTSGTDYLEAAILCLQGDETAAFEALDRAVRRGWRAAWWTRIDPNLAALRKRQQFATVLADIVAHSVAEVAPVATARD